MYLFNGSIISFIIISNSNWSLFIGGRVIVKLRHSFIHCEISVERDVCHCSVLIEGISRWVLLSFLIFYCSYTSLALILYRFHDLEVDIPPPSITLLIKHSYTGIYGRVLRKYVIRNSFLWKWKFQIVQAIYYQWKQC